MEAPPPPAMALDSLVQPSAIHSAGISELITTLSQRQLLWLKEIAEGMPPRKGVTAF